MPRFVHVDSPFSHLLMMLWMSVISNLQTALKVSNFPDMLRMYLLKAMRIALE